MENNEILTFSIDSLTPETLTLARLSDYLKELAALYGSHQHVHFDGIKPGSALLNVAVAETAIPFVNLQLLSVKNGNCQYAEPNKAYASLEKLLYQDHAKGKIYNNYGFNLLDFEGRDKKEINFVSIIQPTSIDGVVIKIGGKDETIPVLVKDLEGNVIKCQVKGSALAKKLSRHYLDAPLRLNGMGKWLRRDSGWNLELLSIQSWDPMDDLTASEVFSLISDVEKNGWVNLEDPIGEWKKMRGSE